MNLPCAAYIDLIKPSKRKMDLANREKALLDYVVDQGFLQDDSLILKLSMQWVDVIPFVPGNKAAQTFIPKAAVTLKSFDA